MKKSIRVLAAVVAVILFFNGLANNVNVSAASVSSNTKNIEKVLKYYKKGQYKKAQKYNKKLSKIVKEKCVKKMPAKIKKAYRKIVKSYNTDNSLGKKYISGYYLTDIDNDNVAELIIRAGSSEADARFYVYDWKKGKVKKIGSVEALHSAVYAYIGHKGFIIYGGLQQSEWIKIVTIKNGKLKVKKVGERDNAVPYFSLRCGLTDHALYTDGYRIDYSDLL